MVVQGNLANADGSFRSEVEDITIPLDRESEAKATTQISLSGNLDAKGNGTGERVWSYRNPNRTEDGSRVILVRTRRVEAVDLETPELRWSD